MNDVDVERNANLLDLIRFSRIPRVREVLAKQLKKGGNKGGRQLIMDFEKSKALYRETLFVRHFQIRGKKRRKQPPPVYWFELTKYKAKEGDDERDSEWRITQLLDSPHSAVKYWEVPPYDILPRDVVKEITKNRMESGKVITFEGIKSKRTGNTMDVSYLWHSDSFMMGTVIHRKRLQPKAASAKSPVQGVKPDKENAYRQFYTKSRNNPEEVQAFKREFMLKWLKQKQDTNT